MSVTSTKGSGNGTVTYVYDATGVKVQKILAGTTGNVVTDYAGNFVYSDASGDTLLEFFAHPEGYVIPTPIIPDGGGGDDGGGLKGFDEGTGEITYSVFRYVFQYKDHLGNVRLSYSDTNGNGAIDPNSFTGTEVIEESNYYPFGLKQRGYNATVSGGNDLAQKYKTFQGQEIHEELGLKWISFKWRNHMPDLGRFFNIDPLATDYTHNSPYAFSENRVINGVELEGLEYATYGYNEFGAKANVEATAMRSSRTETEKKQEVAQTLDVIPIVGDVKGLIEAFTGTDMVTGEDLGITSRILGLFLLSELRTVDKTVDAISDGIKVADNVKDEVKAIGPAGDAGGDVMKQLPENMQNNAKTANSKNGGTVYKDPNNPSGNNVRVDNGNPNSPNSAQQSPYVKEMRDGKQVDANGNEVKSDSKEAHIPKDEYSYKRVQS